MGDPAAWCNLYCYRMIRFHLILVNFATITNPTPNRYSALLKITLFLLGKKFSFSRYAKAPTLFVRPGNWLSSLRSAQASSASVLHLSDFIPEQWTPAIPHLRLTLLGTYSNFLRTCSYMAPIFGLDPIALRPYLSISLPIFNFILWSYYNTIFADVNTFYHIFYEIWQFVNVAQNG